MRTEPDQIVELTAVETIEYGRQYLLGDLEELLGQRLDKDFLGNWQEFVDALKEHILVTNDPTNFAEDLERNSNVIGQNWSLVPILEHPKKEENDD